MAYTRTTQDEYRLFAWYDRSTGWEEIFATATAKEIRQMKRTYENNAPEYRYKTQKVRIKKSGV